MKISRSQIACPDSESKHDLGLFRFEENGLRLDYRLLIPFERRVSCRKSAIAVWISRAATGLVTVDGKKRNQQVLVCLAMSLARSFFSLKKVGGFTNALVLLLHAMRF